jgi:hypothetical protein
VPDEFDYQIRVAFTVLFINVAIASFTTMPDALAHHPNGTLLPVCPLRSDLSRQASRHSL